MIAGTINSINDLIDAVYSGEGCIIYGLGRMGKLVSDNLNELFYNKKHGKNIVYAVSDEKFREGSFVCPQDIMLIGEAVEKYPDYPVIAASVDERHLDMVKLCEKLPSACYRTGIKYYAEQLHEQKSLERQELLLHRFDITVNELTQIRTAVTQIKRKLSMTDGVWQNGSVRFFVPNYPNDLVQSVIVDTQDFFEADILGRLDAHIPEDAVIIDAGSNVGNHSLYWAIRRGARRIYAFEPVPSTFEILRKNIELNHLENRIEAFNVGLSDCDGRAGFNPQTVEKTVFTPNNIASASLAKSDDGEMLVKRLDSMPFTAELDRLDFMKIDVEGFEHEVLRGSAGIIAEFRPVIFIESYPDKYGGTDRILREYGYELTERFDAENYLYVFKG